MIIRRSSDISSSEITPIDIFKQRRKFLRGGAALALGLPAASILGIPPIAQANVGFENLVKTDYDPGEKLTPLEAITTYNNFYEFGTSKEAPAELSKDFQTRPWTVEVEGEINKPKVWDIDEILKTFPLEERIYRLRCVEAWSMVIPWVGFPLSELIKLAQPNSRAKYVRFETLHDPKRMPGQIKGVFGGTLDWPYVEGLRMDEAMNPLSLLAVGLYGEVMPNQNGAPIRLVVPWKYGFKSIKSIVKIQFVEEQPINTWQQQAAREYGFYSNVNPNRPHPRWSQAKERRIGEWLKRDTLMFNGYSDQVAHMYAGMDLQKDF